MNGDFLIESILNEEKSVNRMIQSAAEIIVNHIQKFAASSLRNQKLVSASILNCDNTIQEFTEICNSDMLDDFDMLRTVIDTISIVYQICDADVPEFLLNAFYNGNRGGFTPSKKTLEIVVKIVSVNGKYRCKLDLLESDITHELQHAYQQYYTSLKMDKYYKLAKRYCRPNPVIPYPICVLSYGLYYFAKGEIDATVNALYKMAVKTHCPANENAVKNLEVYKVFIKVRTDVLDAIEEIVSDDNLLDSIRILYKTTPEKVLRDVNVGIKYANTKFRKVIEQYIKDEDVRVSEACECYHSPLYPLNECTDYAI